MILVKPVKHDHLVLKDRVLLVRLCDVVGQGAAGKRKSDDANEHDEDGDYLFGE